MEEPLFEMGQMVTTAGVGALLERNVDFAMFALASLTRYCGGDWGEMREEDKQANDEAVKTGDYRIFAAYENAEHPDWKIWIITEWDRSSTTVLFPDEY